MAKFVHKRRSVLKSTLETLEIASSRDWKEVKLDLVSLVIKDMDYKKVASFGYEFKPGEINRDLQEDLKYIQNNSGADYLPTHEKIIEKIIEYGDSDSFKKICADFYQEELFESMLFERN